ncbi:unnamed protein product [Fusarium fujikuroi]|nr:hypothetical protein CEK25_011699 [Fusarium fujikuroi]VTT56478.1 unnamed protein product [Fusarium fujikuroi]VZI06449.1 unnamed protein product [Fusarium fujikuroi]
MDEVDCCGYTHHDSKYSHIANLLIKSTRTKCGISSRAYDALVKRSSTRAPTTASDQPGSPPHRCPSLLPNDSSMERSKLYHSMSMISSWRCHDLLLRRHSAEHFNCHYHGSKVIDQQEPGVTQRRVFEIPYNTLEGLCTPICDTSMTPHQNFKPVKAGQLLEHNNKCRPASRSSTTTNTSYDETNEGRRGGEQTER